MLETMNVMTMWEITTSAFPLTSTATKANDGGLGSHIWKLTLDAIAGVLYNTSRWRITALQDGYIPPSEFVLPVDSKQGIANSGCRRFGC